MLPRRRYVAIGVFCWTDESAYFPHDKIVVQVYVKSVEPMHISYSIFGLRNLLIFQITKVWKRQNRLATVRLLCRKLRRPLSTSAFWTPIKSIFGHIAPPLHRCMSTYRRSIEISSERSFSRTNGRTCRWSLSLALQIQQSTCVPLYYKWYLLQTRTNGKWWSFSFSFNIYKDINQIAAPSQLNGWTF